MQLFIVPLVLALGIGCGPTPVGDWEGTVRFEADNGETFKNELSAEKDGSSYISLYALFENPDFPGDSNAPEYLIGRADYDATWQVAKGVATFDMQCDWASCDFDLEMTCEFEDPGMTCDARPDFYGDDHAMLQWTEL